MLRPWNLDLKINEKHSHLPVYKQIIETIIEAVNSGKLKQGYVLPGTRKMADILKVSRNTVVEAYNHLEYEGWVVSHPRSGTLISHYLPEGHKKNIHNNSRIIHAMNQIFFDEGLPDPNLSPMNDLLREYKQVIKKIKKHQLHIFNNTAGYEKLRTVLSQMLNHQRRIIGDESNICITKGEQMAFFLISQYLFQKDDCVIVEHPGYRPAWNTFEHAGASILHIPVDPEGILVDEIKKHLEKGKKIKAVFITPNSQYPTTVILSEERRAALIELSNTYDFFVIEYDYCIDLNYDGTRFLPLCSDENLRNYMYIGSFNTSVSHFINLAYIVGSKDIIEKIKTYKNMIDMNGDPIMERAFHNLIEDGTYTKHLKKSVLYYKNKRDFFEDLLNKYLKDKIRFTKPVFGLSYWITPVKHIRDDYNTYLKDELISKGIIPILMGRDYYSTHEGEGFLVSFGSVSEKKLEEAVKIVAKYF
ncbi:hypothetical protein ACM46_11180 [Chryseobacterium angstadtii]|uniref:HTH gntR-type domain-containing protein n=1 Tax=Chryseobacterium angstadtii TaxID=558151 RepID=A0A0J7L6V2_9FLAO|nr:PLP-dependent aminotransferase family protein [Chryseobacterium angstadtii]KMQ64785.1 hypothetical protein ACM46_11180 [Chryseobacterium angstadtii]